MQGVSRRIAFAAAVAALVATAAAPQASADPPTRSCGWQVKVSGDQVRFGFNDGAARYWGAILPVPAGGHIEVRGDFPHARYTSLHTYSARMAAIDALADVEIAPEPGSSNPYLPGADRTAAEREYAVRVVGERKPAGTRAPNTLYTESESGAESTRASQMAGIVLRIYQADLGLGDTGGVELPALTLVGPTGERTPVPECPTPAAGTGGVDEANAGAGSSQPAPETNLLSQNPPRWFKYENVFNAYASIFASDGIPAAIGDEALRFTHDNFPPGGILENEHIRYMFTTTSQGHGQIVAFRGRAPTAPRTLGGEPVMGTGQVRYWSVCSEQPTSNYLACLNDDAFPLDAGGRYTLVISTLAARPRNAVESCGVAWLPAGPLPSAILLLRHMLPDPSFEHAVQRIPHQGAEEATLGEYHPTGTYYATTQDFERLGCPAAG